MRGPCRTRTRILTDLKCEAHVLSISECEARISTKRDSHVSTQREVRVSTRKCETRVQPKSPHLQGLESSSSDVPSNDRRNYLTRKRSVHQITPRCHCEQLISAVLLDYHCGFQTNKLLAFSWLSRLQNQPKDNDPRRRNHSPISSTQK